MATWLRSGLPRDVAWREWKDGESALTDWARLPYDLVWFSHCATWLALGQVDRGPAIVDFDNLEDEKLRTLIHVRGLQRSGSGHPLPLARRVRRVLGAILDRADLGRWTRAQQRTADSTKAVLVCSDLDRRRLGHDAAVVIPNGYEVRSPPSAYVPPADPCLTMISLLTYPPNGDAARFFAERVLPSVREDVPTARFRLVGRSDDQIRDLAKLPGVDVVGEVHDLQDVFRTTSAVVVPLRAGSGTRIKVLEAFAQRLPVVSTTLGCEGVEARPGTDLLVGDTPEELAAACVRILADPAVAALVADAGHRVWQSRYRWDDIREQIRRLAVEVAAS